MSEHDRNGWMSAVSSKSNRAGTFVTFHYQSGRVTHFVPNRVLPKLKHEVESALREGGK